MVRRINKPFFRKERGAGEKKEQLLAQGVAQSSFSIPI